MGTRVGIYLFLLGICQLGAEMADANSNLWPIVTSLILPAIASEFNVARPPLLTLAQNIGLLAGAIVWGFGCDIWGRRIAFNATLGESLLMGVKQGMSRNRPDVTGFIGKRARGTKSREKV